MGERLALPALASLALACVAAPAIAQEVADDVEQAFDAISERSDAAFARFSEQGAEAALPLFEAIDRDTRDLLGPDHYQSIVARSNHAYVLLSLNRFAEAEPLYAEVVARSRATLGDRDPDTLQAWNDHALVLEQLGRLGEAAPLYRQALDGRREVLGPNDPATIVSLNNYGTILIQLGRYDEAEPALAEALKLQRAVHGPDNSEAVAMLSNYAYLLAEMGRSQEAEPLAAEALATSRRVMGDRHPQTIKTANTLAAAQTKNGKLGEALQTTAGTLQMATQAFGAEAPATLAIATNYAAQMSALGRSAEAEAMLGGQLSISRQVLGEAHPTTLLMRNNYATILSALGRELDAGEEYAEVLRLRRQVLGDRHPATITALANYGISLQSQGRLDEADPIVLDAYVLAKEVLGGNHPQTLVAANNYAQVLSDTGRVREATEVYREALAISVATQGPQHPDALRLKSNLAHSLEEADRYEEAIQLHVEALTGRREVLGDTHPDTLDSFLAAAEVLELAGMTQEAETRLVASLALRRGAQGDSHPGTLNHAANVATFYLDSTQTPAKALDYARLVVRGRRERDEALGGTPQGDAQLSRDSMSRSFDFMLLAEADWSRRAASTGSGDALQAEAFAALQDVLAGSASRAIAQSAARRAAERSGGLGELARERQDLADRWLALEQQVNATLAETGPGAEARRTSLRQQIAMLEARMDEIDARLRAEAPDYFALIRPQPLAESAASEMLREDEAALMLVPTRWGTHVMAVTADGVAWHRSEWTEQQVDAAVTRLLWDVGANVDVSAADADKWIDEGEGAYPFDFKTAAALYGQLLGPLEATLEGKSHVFVMASGMLSALPLGLLVSDVPDGPSGDPAVLRSAPWLADRFALLQVPSLQSIAFLRDYRTSDDAEPATPFIGFGNPVLAGEAALRGARGMRGGEARQSGFGAVFNAGTTRGGKGIANVAELKAMSSLPGTATELTAMWEAFGKPRDALHLAAEASEPEVRASKLDAEVIAFATHGLLAGEVGGTAEPGLVLTPPEQPSEHNDGYLAMSEIAGLKMDADWVILSACNTAAGDGSDGASGLSGLARAFFYAGARNLLASYWPVRDDVSALLTVRTVEIARSDPALTRAQAFQQAMREIRNDPSADSDNDTWAHPNAWAPFVFVGDR